MMSTSKLLLGIVTLAFGAFSTWVMIEVGYFGIWLAGFEGPGSMQILLDLIVACMLILTWMIRDARQRDRNPWPFVILTLTAGSVGPLLYLLTANTRTTLQAKPA